MLAAAMPKPRTSAATKTRGRKPSTPKVATARADGRPKSALTIAGEQAKLDAERTTLRAALVAAGWVASKAGADPTVGVSDPKSMSRLIDRLGLRAEYDAAQPK